MSIEHGPYSDLVYDKKTKKKKLVLNKKGQILIEEFLKKYPNPVYLLYLFTKKDGKNLAWKWLKDRDSEKADRAKEAALHGVVRAAIKYNPEKHTKFSTYVRYWIYHSVKRLDEHLEKFICTNQIAYENKENKIESYYGDSSYYDSFSLLIILPKDEQEIIKYSYILNKNDVEIAKEFGVSKQSIQQKRTKALKTLRIYYGKSQRLAESLATGNFAEF